jgi:hypothetical protein
MAVQEPTRNALIARITFSVFGTLTGLAILLCFVAFFHNINAAAWGFVSAIFASITLGLHLKYYNDQFSECASSHSWLVYFAVIGLKGQVASIVGFAIYITLAVERHQEFTPHNDGFYVTSICCALAWIWSLLVFFYARRYNNLCQERDEELNTSLDGYTRYQQTFDSFEREASDSSVAEIIRQTTDGG